MKSSLKFALLLCAASPLTACSAASATDGRTVEAGPITCVMMSDDGTAAMSVTCRVTVDNGQASTEGIDVSVTNILEVNVLPGVCRSANKAEVLASTADFDTQVRAELSAQYDRSGIGWTISSVVCDVTEL